MWRNVVFMSSTLQVPSLKAGGTQLVTSNIHNKASRYAHAGRALCYPFLRPTRSRQVSKEYLKHQQNSSANICYKLCPPPPPACHSRRFKGESQ